MKKIITAAIALLILTGCAENPDSDIVIHKDMEKVIDEAQHTDESKADVEQLRQETEYNAEFENKSLRVKVQADADIITPEAERLSVIHVEKAQFSQEFVDQVRAALIGDQPIWDGKLLMLRTKADVLEEIGDHRAQMQNPPAEIAPENIELYKEELQQGIDERLQPEYNAAPEKLVFSDYPSDGLLHPLKQKTEEENIAAGGIASPDAYYTRKYEMFSDAELLSCVTDGSDGMYSILFVVNSPDTGSTLSFERTPLGLTSGANVGLDFVTGKKSQLFGLPENTLAYYCGNKMNYEQLPDNTTNLSQADAQTKAEDLLFALGLNDFAFYEGGLYTETVYFAPSFEKLNPVSQDDPRYYRTSYILRYFRHIDGVPLLRGGGKNGESDANYRRKAWDDEMIEIRVDDNGIIGFAYQSPLKMLETTVSGAAMKPFSEIKDTFEKMAPMMTAHEISEFSVEVTVTKIELSYIRIAEKDSFDTGYAVPVWGFCGTRTIVTDSGDRMEISGSMQNLLMSINAIDGSVIVPGAGY